MNIIYYLRKSSFLTYAIFFAGKSFNMIHDPGFLECEYGYIITAIIVDIVASIIMKCSLYDLYSMKENI